MNNQKVNLTSLDFETIRGSLKTFLRNQDEFTDFDFEGSGLSVLLDVLAYNSQNNAYLANMLANEMEIDSAILRMNVVSRAKLLGYTPKSNTSAKATISVTVEDPSATSKSLYLPRGTKFNAGSAGNQFVFVTLKDYNLDQVSEGVYTHNDIEIHEGILKNFIWDKTLGARFIIPNKTVDVSSIKVAVYENPSSFNFDVYSRAFGMTKIDNASDVYWLYETDGSKYEIKFGDNVFGKNPPDGSAIYVEYLDTRGPEANNISRFSLQGSFAGYENAEIDVVTVINSFGGSNRESTEAIKRNATRFFSSQNRAVTVEDFRSLVNEIYPYTRSVSIWGGEENNPRVYGKVFLSIIPQNFSFLTKDTKKDIIRKMKDKMIVGIQPELKDPEFIRLNIDLSVDVRRSFVENINTFGSSVRQMVVDFYNERSGAFENDFHYSDLISLVRNHSRAVISTKADYTLSIDGNLFKPVYDFGNVLSPLSIKSNKVAFFNSTTFGEVKDNEMGELHWNNMVVGKVNYETGLLSLYEQPTDSIRGGLEFIVTPQNESIYAKNQRTLIFFEPRFSVTIKAV